MLIKKWKKERNGRRNIKSRKIGGGVMSKRQEIIGNKIRSPYFDDSILIVTNYFTDKFWRFRFEEPKDIRNNMKNYWSNTPYSHFENNGLVVQTTGRTTAKEQREIDGQIWDSYVKESKLRRGEDK